MSSEEKESPAEITTRITEEVVSPTEESTMNTTTSTTTKKMDPSQMIQIASDMATWLKNFYESGGGIPPPSGASSSSAANEGLVGENLSPPNKTITGPAGGMLLQPRSNTVKGNQESTPITPVLNPTHRGNQTQMREIRPNT